MELECWLVSLVKHWGRGLCQALTGRAVGVVVLSPLPVLASQNAVCSPDPDALMVHHTAKEHKQGSRSGAF